MILGSHPERFAGFGGIDFWKDGRETYDNVNVVCTYPNGVKGHFMSTLSNRNGSYRIRILGNRATIEISFNEALFYPEPLPETPEEAKGIVDGVTDATRKLWSSGEAIVIPFEDEGKDPTTHAMLEFEHCIRTGTQPRSNVLTGRDAALAVHLSNEAMRSGSVTQWEEAFAG
jgi:predicted dehydrogenase